jgi:hypothetical protein
VELPAAVWCNPSSAFQDKNEVICSELKLDSRTSAERLPDSEMSCMLAYAKNVRGRSMTVYIQEFYLQLTTVMGEGRGEINLRLAKLEMQPWMVVWF